MLVGIHIMNRNANHVHIYLYTYIYTQQRAGKKLLMALWIHLYLYNSVLPVHIYA